MNAPIDRRIPRLASSRLDGLLGALPAVLVAGPRAIGKTTLATERAATIVRVDAPEHAILADNPDAVLRRLEAPVLLDEWQAHPGVLGAVKRIVDGRSGNGQFLLTGSVRVERAGLVWPGTGRLGVLDLHPIAQAEVEETGTSFLDGLLVGAPPLVTSSEGLGAILDRLLLGGFPDVLARPDVTEEQAAIYHDAYLRNLLTRDVSMAGEVRDIAGLRRLLAALTATAGSAVAKETLRQAADVNARTLTSWLAILSDLWVIHAVPAWSSNAIKRLTKSPQWQLSVPALGARLLGRDVAGLLLDPMLGGMVQSFVAAEIRAQLAVLPTVPTLHHLRTDKGAREVDLVIERPDGRIIGVEVKAADHATTGDARHLAWLRDELGDRFVAGVVLHAGSLAHDLGNRLWACPIPSLWSPGSDVTDE